MIVSFSIENWMSFRDKVSFSMVASREKQHGERVPKVAKYQTRILPIAAIYGGNASGKTNFFKALNFVKKLVLDGTRPGRPVPVKTYLLDNSFSGKPSRFSLEILIAGIIYEFSFVVTRKEILQEKLVKVTSSSEKILYDRKDGNIRFDPSLDDNKFIHFVSQGTRSNQLFLTNSVSQNVDIFRPVYDWFEDNLVLVGPDSRFGHFEHFFDKGHPLSNVMNEVLPTLDIGISRLGGEETSFENNRFLKILESELEEDVKEGEGARIVDPATDERFVVTRNKTGKLIAKKLITYHAGDDGTEVKFDIRQESDGSKRMIDLLPAFLAISTMPVNKVYIIDELDRSLHSLLTRQLIERYLENCNTDSRSQLLITTHDMMLMDQAIFRRDEMWITERKGAGDSELFSFSEYKDVRYDKDVRKSYLQGRLGGIPKILSNNVRVN